MAGFNNYRHAYWIGIGQDGHFYTLRETHPVYKGSSVVLNGVYQGTIELSHHHVQNLSQDPTEAIAKAKTLAAERGIPLDPVTVEDLQGQLEEIKRATAEQLAERQRADAARQAQWEAERAEREVMLRDMVECGVCPIGRYAGKELAEIDRGYATWLLDKREEFEEGSLMRALADKVAAEHAHLRLPAPDPAAKYGQLKLRSDIEATVVRVHGFENAYGYTGLVTLVTDDGICLLAKGGWRVLCTKTRLGPVYAVEAKPGERVKIKATVVDYREYKGQMQTVINRVKEVV